MPAFTAVLAAGAIAAAPAQAGMIATSSVAGPIRSEGVVDLEALAAAIGQASSGLGQAWKKGPADFHALPPRGFGLRHTYSPAAEAARAPHATAQGKMAAAAGSRSFVGLDHFDQRILADNGNQLTVEPPNPALAIGAGLGLGPVMLAGGVG